MAITLRVAYALPGSRVRGKPMTTNGLKRLRAWVATAAILVAGGLVQGCSSPCGDYEAAMYRCGQSFNRAKCDQNIQQCSPDDVRTIENSAQCMQNPSVCSNGSVNDSGKFAACVLPILSVSSSCQNAF